MTPQNEADIRVQFNRAVQLARRNGSAIAIGHPHPSTVRVLQQMLPGLPADITLVASERSALMNLRWILLVRVARNHPQRGHVIHSAA